jgi:hypothetical protein
MDLRFDVSNANPWSLIMNAINDDVVEEVFSVTEPALSETANQYGSQFTNTKIKCGGGEEDEDTDSDDSDLTDDDKSKSVPLDYGIPGLKKPSP